MRSIDAATDVLYEARLVESPTQKKSSLFTTTALTSQTSRTFITTSRTPFTHTQTLASDEDKQQNDEREKKEGPNRKKSENRRQKEGRRSERQGEARSMGVSFVYGKRSGGTERKKVVVQRRPDRPGKVHEDYLIIPSEVLSTNRSTSFCATLLRGLCTRITPSNDTS